MATRTDCLPSTSVSQRSPVNPSGQVQIIVPFSPAMQVALFKHGFGSHTSKSNTKFMS